MKASKLTGWRNCSLIFYLNLLLLFSVSLAAAAPTVNGSNGAIAVPTADVLQPGHFAVGYYNLHSAEHGQKDLVWVGIVSPAPRWELGLVNQTQVNLKYSLRQESVLTPGLALGCEAGQSQRSFYLVASKTLPYGFRLHTGLGDGHYHGLFIAVEKNLFASGLRGANIFPATALLAEYDGRQMNYGMRLVLQPGLRLQAGWLHSEPYWGLTFTY